MFYAKNDLQVGRIYKALFVVDGDKNYVSNLTVEAYEATIVENKGTTDDEGKPYKTANAIGAYLGQYDYTLVTEYTKLGNTLADSYKTVGDELIIAEVYGYTTELVIDTVAAADKVVINWHTGDILVKQPDGSYKTEWHWSDRFGYYFKVVGGQTIKDTINVIPEGATNNAVGIEVMDEDDMAALLALLVETSIKNGDTVYSFKYANNINGDGIHVDTFGWYNSYELKEGGAYAPYAYLEAYDLDDDGKAEYAIFEEYRLGYMSNDTVYCADCKADIAAIKLAAITAPFVGDPMYNGNDKDYNPQPEDIGYSYAYIGQFVPCAHTPRVKCAQFVEGYEPIMNANGRAVEGYVIYGVDRASNDIKIVKQITKLGDKNQVDADSYIATGRVLGYSIYNNTVNIDGKDITTSSPIHQSVFTAGSSEIAWATTMTSYLSTLYNQYITYVVVDGAIVYAEPCGAEDKEWIVVEGFRGLNRDGKVVIYGYSTEDVVLDEFQIEVVNGNWGGNWMWNLEALAELLTKGALLQITSYDAENDLYYVDTNEVITTEGNNVTITESDGLFRVTNYEGTKKTQRMSANDKYIIIGKDTNEGFKPVYVHEGLLGDGWSVTGDVISGYKSITSGTPSAVTVVLTNVDTDSMVGFDGETSGISYIWVMDGFYRIPEANYDRGDYAGYSEYVVQGYDLLNPNNNATATCTNFVPTEGLIYKAVDGVILEDNGMSWNDFVTDMKKYVGEADLNASKYYVVENFKVSSGSVPTFQVNGSVVPGTYEPALKGLSADIGKQIYGYSASAVDLLNSANWFQYTLDGDNLSTTWVFDCFDPDWTYAEALLIYNLETGVATVWYDKVSGGAAFATNVTKTADFKVDLTDTENGIINMTIVYDKEKVGADLYTTIKSVTISFEGVTYNEIQNQLKVYTFWDDTLGDTYKTVVSIDETPVDGTYANKYTEDGLNVYCKSFTFTPNWRIKLDSNFVLKEFIINFTPQNGVEHSLAGYILINPEVSCGYLGTGNLLNDGVPGVIGPTTSTQSTINDAAVTLIR